MKIISLISFSTLFLCVICKPNIKNDPSLSSTVAADTDTLQKDTEMNYYDEIGLDDDNIDNDDDDNDNDDDNGEDNRNDDKKNEKSIIKIESKSQIFVKNINDTVRLPCKADDKNLVQIWRLNDVMLFQSGIAVGDKRKFIYDEGDGSLEIPQIDENDQGIYNCEYVLSKNLRAYINHTLKVRAPPRVHSIQAKNNVTTLKYGEILQLTCNASGYPIPTISWHKGEERLGTEGKILTIPNIKHRDSGSYRCLADNKIGRPAYSTINIKVEHKPSIEIEKLTSKSDDNHQDMELKCIVHAEPRADVVWQKDGRNIISTQHTQLNRSRHDYILLIRNLNESDYGTYTCLASNSIGETKKETKITKTPIVLEFIKPQKSVKDVTLTWKVESHTNIIQHELQYRKKGDNTWHTAFPQNTIEEKGVNKIRYVLKGLDTGVYEARVRSQNTHGWSDYSETILFEGIYAKHGKHNKKDRKDMKDKNTQDLQDTISLGIDEVPAQQQENLGASQVSDATKIFSTIVPIISVSFIFLLI